MAFFSSLKSRDRDSKLFRPFLKTLGTPKNPLFDTFWPFFMSLFIVKKWPHFSEIINFYQLKHGHQNDTFLNKSGKKPYFCALKKCQKVSFFDQNRVPKSGQKVCYLGIYFSRKKKMPFLTLFWSKSGFFRKPTFLDKVELKCALNLVLFCHNWNVEACNDV